MSLVVVKRGRRGQIQAATFRPRDGANPLRSTCHQGQRYSFEESLPSGLQAWKHRDLMSHAQLAAMFGDAFEDPEQIDLFLRAIFRAVPLSILQRQRRA